MAIRTELGREDIEAVATAWGLGPVNGFAGMPEGSINTLYRIDAGAKYVVRLSEGRREEEVRFETSLLQFLSAAHLPIVTLVPRVDGAAYGVVRDRFACVFRWGAGEHVQPRDMSDAQAMELGRVLGRMHAVTQGFAATLENRYGPSFVLPWVREIIEESRRSDRPDDPELWAAVPLLESAVHDAEQLPQVPRGVVHADLFPDNVRFVGDRIACALDFEMACEAPFVFDLGTAILANCWDDDFAPSRVRSLVSGYVAERPLSAEETRGFRAWTEYAALRFTITRIRDFHRAPLAGDKLVRKDWRRFRDRLRRLRALSHDGWLELCGLR